MLKFPRNATIQEITREGSNAMQVWKNIPKIIEGDLSSTKSTIVVTTFDHNTYSRWGGNLVSAIPRTISLNKFNERCTFEQNNSNCHTPPQYAQPKVSNWWEYVYQWLETKRMNITIEQNNSKNSWIHQWSKTWRKRYAHDTENEILSSNLAVFTNNHVHR